MISRVKTLSESVKECREELEALRKVKQEIREYEFEIDQMISKLKGRTPKGSALLPPLT